MFFVFFVRRYLNRIKNLTWRPINALFLNYMEKFESTYYTSRTVYGIHIMNDIDAVFCSTDDAYVISTLYRVSFYSVLAAFKTLLYYTRIIAHVLRVLQFCPTRESLIKLLLFV